MTACGATHLTVPNPFHPLIPACGTTGNQEGPRQRVNQAGNPKRSTGSEIINNRLTWS
jgi:hypothetical protein